MYTSLHILSGSSIEVQLLTLALVELYKKSKIPLPTSEDLSDRSKSDSFTKAFAIIQSTWLVVQSIARVSAGLSISELELATMAYVLCAIIIYAFWWYKPFSVTHVTILHYDEKDLPGYAANRFEDRSEFRYSQVWRRVSDLSWDSFMELIGDTGPLGAMHIQMFYIVGTIFSAIHLSAWNWTFVNPVSRILWRSFGVAATGAAPLALTLMLVLDKNWLGGIPEKVAQISFAFIFGAYVIARLGLLVLVMYSFRSMPASVYETVDWTTYFPYFS